MIRLTGITKDFPSPSGETLRVLDGVDLELAEGGSIAIQGPSGSGKSTLLGILAGLEQPILRGGAEVELRVHEEDLRKLQQLGATGTSTVGAPSHSMLQPGCPVFV